MYNISNIYINDCDGTGRHDWFRFSWFFNRAGSSPANRIN